ncbi:MAG: RNA methyltransferase [Lachnospiraceae bacterium]|nr:RNA methyltransferase [Lachnospiraceae bacterium]
MEKIQEITSLSNPQIKYIKSLQNKPSLRKKEGLFVVEGLKIFMETPKNLIKSVYISDNMLEDLSKGKGFTEDIRKKALLKLENISYTKISDDISKSISDTVTPQGIFVIIKNFKYDLKDIIKKNKAQTFLVLEEIKDPGNMGTIIRTAEGAGISAIIMNSKCVDVFNPKVTRATMGSIFRVPFIIEETLNNSIKLLKENGVVTYAAHLSGSEYFDEENLKGSVAIFIGNEAKGLSDEVTKMADRLIKIPMEGELESLNAGIAAGILMYEAKRKRV